MNKSGSSFYKSRKMFGEKDPKIKKKSNHIINYNKSFGKKNSPLSAGYQESKRKRPRNQPWKNVLSIFGV